MLDVKGELPFKDSEGVKWKSLAEALHCLDFREQFLRGTPEEIAIKKAQMETYRSGIKSLALTDHDEHAKFLREYIEAGGKIDIISDLFYHHRPLTIFKTTQPLTILPDCEGRVHLDVMIMPGHALEKENPNDGTKVYDLNGKIPMPFLQLYRDTASLMLRNGWRPKEEHFSDSCSRKEIDKLLARGRKSVSYYEEPSRDRK